jgi:D-alanyl-D-alanine dipeptidase
MTAFPFDDTVLGSPHSRLGSVVDVELVEGADDMGFYGMGTDVQDFGYFRTCSGSGNGYVRVIFD